MDSSTVYSSSASSSVNLASVSSIVKHILASKHDLPNVFGANILVTSSLNIAGGPQIADYNYFTFAYGLFVGPQ